MIVERQAVAVTVRLIPEGHRVEGPKHVQLGRPVPRPDRGPAVQDGAWAEWHWDGARLIVQTSPHGLIPLYYCAEPGLIAVSTSIFDLLPKVPAPEADWPALAVMLRLGCFIGDRTAFRQIRMVPANATLVWADGRLEIDTSPTPVRRETLSREQAIDGYLELVRAAVARRPPPTPFAMPLSGGRDSRHLLLELTHLGHQPEKIFTSQHYLPTSGADTEGAQAVASRLGLDHEIVTLPRPKFYYEHVKNVLTDFSTFEHSWGIELAGRLGQFHTIYDGLNGGVLFGRTSKLRARYEAYVSGQLEAISRDMLADRDTALRAVLAPHFYSRIPLDLAVAELSEELRRFAEFCNPIQAFYYFNRVRRNTALYSFGVLNVDNTMCPLDDIDLVAFALSMPTELSLDGTLQEEAIRRRFPAFRDVPFDGAVAISLEESVSPKETRYLLDVAKACLASGRSKISERSFILTRSAAALILRDPSRASWWAEVAGFVLQFEDHLASQGPLNLG